MYHILICDDEQDIVNALKIYLASPDFKLYEANTGVQALKVMEEEDIHLVLLDIMMPEMDGISAMVKIRVLALRRQQDDGHIALLTDLHHSGNPVHLRHHNIQQHKMNVLLFYDFQCLQTGTGLEKGKVRVG